MVVGSLGGEGKEQDLLAVSAEIQRMLEASGYKPLPVTQISKALSMQSHMILLQYAIGLVGVIEMHQKFFKITEIDGCQMISPNGVPWLGPELRSNNTVAKGNNQVPAPTSEEAPACGTKSLPSGGLLRGKALEMMSELAETPAMQEALKDIANTLLFAPGKTLLVSEVGSKIGQTTRSFLRTVKLRVVQLLQCFPNDFALTGSGPATSATYRHADLKTKYVPQPSVTELNSGRYYRLLKLSADATEQYSQCKSIAAREAIGCLDNALFVDCRSEGERAVSMIPGAVPMGQVVEAHLAVPTMVIAYCCIGLQSAEWCHIMTEGIWGYKMRLLSGGIASWVHHGGTLMSSMTGQPTTEVHCWVRELAPFFPVPNSGYEVVLPSNDLPVLKGHLAHPSNMRHLRLKNLAWEVRLRYWPSVFCIEPADLIMQLENGAGPRLLLVDCRTAEERQVSTIYAPGSAVIAAEELRRRALDIVNMYDKIVTFCTISGRSGLFCKKLIDEMLEDAARLGYTPDHADELRRKVTNILGGIAAWLHAGGTLMDLQGRPINRVHPWCNAFMDMFPLEGLELVFDEFTPVPQEAVSLIACKSACGETAAVPQRLLQMCSMLPREVIDDSLTQAMQNCVYED